MKRSLRPPRKSSELSESIHQQSSKYTLAASAALTLTVVLLLWVVAAPVAQAQAFTTLYNFAGPPDGLEPYGGLIQDQAGNLYGTTYGGGDIGCQDYYRTPGCGLVFKVNAGGSETVLHRFTPGTKDGEYPFAPLLRDRYGNLYGTTIAGGTGDCASDGLMGCGVVFEIDTAGIETILYNFLGGTSDGCYPGQGLVMDSVGNLYGTTEGCGSSNHGTVFKFSKSGKEVLLHSFTGTDGSSPAYGHPLIDMHGNLYGLTSGQGNGIGTGGTLYKLTTKGKLTVLHSFGGGDGCYPMGTPAMDESGNLYGTAAECGKWNAGTVWKVSMKGAVTVLHNFGADGIYPEAGVVLDWKGNVYGNTTLGGAYYGGTLWELREDGGFSVLHSFPGGSWVLGDVLRDAKGRMYGSTVDGGTHLYGSVWSYK
jgi:uncharacterized repeat protein (TIGR03803 family)